MSPPAQRRTQGRAQTSPMARHPPPTRTSSVLVHPAARGRGARAAGLGESVTRPNGGSIPSLATASGQRPHRHRPQGNASPGQPRTTEQGDTMTQPQQYPPQGYAPQYPPQTPPAPPQYAPQPQYAPPAQYPQQPAYAPPAPPQAPPAPGYGGAHPQGHTSFRPPDPRQSDIVRPRLLDFGRDNRLVLISPTKIERGVPNNLGKPGE